MKKTHAWPLLPVTFQDRESQTKGMIVVDGIVLFHGCTPPSMEFLGFGIMTAPWPLAHPTTSTDKKANVVLLAQGSDNR